jgi:hypothetical protein
MDGGKNDGGRGEEDGRRETGDRGLRSIDGLQVGAQGQAEKAALFHVALACGAFGDVEGD